MNEAVYVILMVFYLHGGGVATQSSTASSYEFCKANGSIEVQRQIDKGMRLGNKQVKIDKGKFICLVFE